MTKNDRDMAFTQWITDFEVARDRRGDDPDWALGARLHPAIVRSIQRFQVGEAGDGANLIAKADAAGDSGYARAVRLFVAEEQNHARLLARLLMSANAPTISGHWSDWVFVRLRRALGLRLELMVLLVAEVIALRYYRALRDGVRDALAAEVAARILADEERHVPFHCQRLGEVPGAATVAWKMLLVGTAVTVALDHGEALRCLGVTRRQFTRDVVNLFKAAWPDRGVATLGAGAASSR